MLAPLARDGSEARAWPGGMVAGLPQLLSGWHVWRTLGLER